MNKLLGPFWRNKPRAPSCAIDPHEIIDPRYVHLNNPSPLSPEPAKPTPKTASADSHTPTYLWF